MLGIHRYVQHRSVVSFHRPCLSVHGLLTSSMLQHIALLPVASHFDTIYLCEAAEGPPQAAHASCLAYNQSSPCMHVEQGRC